MNAAQLRADFPEFANITTFPDASVNFWLSVAVLSLDPLRWDTMLDVGTELFVAHHLALSAREAETVAAGGIPGAVKGIVTNKAVDKVSVGMDASSVSLTDGGFWNMTTYGIQFLQLARMIGAGGIQVGAGGTPPGVPFPGSLG